MKAKVDCWICDTDMVYVKDEEYEKLGWYRFDCKKCGESVLCPQDAPYLTEKDFV